MRFLIIFLLLFFPITYSHAAKRALIIAIGNYNMKETGWPPLFSINDIPYIKKVLIQNEFTDIEVLKDSQASRACINKVAEDFMKKCDRGDIVVIYFSSHGQLLLIRNPDGSITTDESIVAWGAPANRAYVTGEYRGELHLRSAEIGKIRDGLRSKIGPDGELLLFFDACHAGGLSYKGRKDLSTYRGGPPLLIEGPPAENYKTGDFLANESETSLEMIDNNKMAPFVAISACGSDESNKEDAQHRCGSLTYGVSAAFHRIKPGDTYQTLFTYITQEVVANNPRQHPVVFGNINRELFSGEVKIDKFFNIIGGGCLTENHHSCLDTINGGLLNGLTKGSVLDAYLLNGKSKGIGKVVFSAEVTEVYPVTSEIRILGSLKKNTTWADYILYANQIKESDDDLKVGIEDLRTTQAELYHSLTRLFTSTDGVKILKEQADLSVRYNAESSCMVVLDEKKGTKLKEEKDPELLKQFLITYSRIKSIRSFVSQDSNFHCVLELNKQCLGGEVTHQVSGDIYNVSIRNMTNRRVYLNIVLFEPEGMFHILRADYLMDVNGSYTGKLTGLRSGKNELMCIATGNQLLLEQIGVATKGAGVGSYIITQLFDVHK